MSWKSSSNMRPGDWKCPTCATVNFASRNDCRNRCSGVTRPSNAGPPAPKAGDWQCPCGSNNFASRNMCFGCQKPKPVASSAQQQPPVPKAGDWICSACGTNNFAARPSCFKCQAPQQQQPQQAPAAPPTTSAQSAPSSGTVGQPSTDVKAGDWQCQLCSANNFSSRKECYGCKAPKGSPPAPQVPVVTPPATKQAGGGVADPSTTVKAGDWQCHCGVNNFASRAACYKCRQPKGSSGSPAGATTAGGSTQPKSGPYPLSLSPLPSTVTHRPGDWHCPQCTVLNFGTRTVCVGCGIERPVPKGSATAGPSGKLDGSDAVILGSFALPSYWKSDATSAKAQLLETGYFAAVADTLWSKFSTATKGRTITSVVRVENVALWHGYCAEVQRLVSKHPAQAPPIPSKWEPKTLQILPDQFHINESYLCHGTSPDVAKLIVEGGFDPSHSGESAGALFGQGTYFSDSLEKVMRYSKGCVVVARVALGDVAVPPHPGTPSKYRRPPVKGSSSSGEEYDSIVATASANLKEFIVYRHTKAYPEYLIFHN